MRHGAAPLHEDVDVTQLGTGAEKQLRHGAATWTEEGTALMGPLVPETWGARGGGQPLLSHSPMARV